MIIIYTEIDCILNLINGIAYIFSLIIVMVYVFAEKVWNPITMPNIQRNKKHLINVLSHWHWIRRLSNLLVGMKKKIVCRTIAIHKKNRIINLHVENMFNELDTRHMRKQ